VAFGADPHHVFFKVVPTTDPNATFGLAIGVFLLMLFYLCPSVRPSVRPKYFLSNFSQ
jgi:F0F1-type ATP synthase membrane subunit a